LLCGSEKHGEYALKILRHIVVPKPQHAIAVAFEVRRSTLIRGARRVLTAIKLDDELELVAREIAEVRTDRRLPTEVVILERRLAKVPPKDTLDISGIATKYARARDALVSHARLSFGHPRYRPDRFPTV
jgi:hypothetical protein